MYDPPAKKAAFCDESFPHKTTIVLVRVNEKVLVAFWFSIKSDWKEEEIWNVVGF